MADPDDGGAPPDPAHLGEERTPDEDAADPAAPGSRPTGNEQAQANQEVDPPA